VFIADAEDNRVVVDKPNGSGGYTQGVVDSTGLSFPEGVAVDGSGDVFIADTDHDRVLVDKPNASGGYTQSVVDDQTNLQPTGVAVDGSGDVFIADLFHDRVVVDKPNAAGGYTQSVVDSGLSSPQGVAVDRSGDVFIADLFHNRVVVAKPNGSGGYTQSVVDSTGLSFPLGVAVDGSGGVFIADTDDDRLLLDKPDGSGGYTQSVVDDTGLSSPIGLAVDGSGDVFIADYGRNRVVVDKPNGSGGYTQSVVQDTNLSGPHAVAVNSSGDVFIADTDNNRVVVDKPNGSGGYWGSVVADTGLSYPDGVAVDSSGDVFIADTDNNRVVLDKPNSSGGYTQSVVADTGLSYPTGVAVDSSGDVFIADTDNNRVVVDKPNGSGAYTRRVVDADLSGPEGVAVDGSGNVFIADTDNERVVEHSTTAPTALFTSAQSAGSLTVAFTDASVAVSPATITGRSWNFGDGSPFSSAEDPTHAYGAPGTYTVSLTVTDSTGQTSTDTQRVVVAPVHASLTYPTVGQTNVNTANPFSWADIPAGQGYQLWIGTSPGDGSLLKSGALSAGTSSYQMPALSVGVTLWARLYTQVAGNWGSYQDITFTVTANRVAFTYPTAGQQNINTLTPFAWSPQTDAQAYRLTIATEPGGVPLANSGILAANVTTYREPALPTGQTLYARLAWEIAGSWSDYQDVSFTAAPNPVAFTHPTQGQTAVSSPTTFTWSTSPVATGYQLWVGTSRGSGSLLKSGLLKASTASYQMPALPAGQTLWARIYTGVASGWGNWQDISFTTAAASSSSASMTLTRRARSPTS
jgi:PKD repeat protein